MFKYHVQDSLNTVIEFDPESTNTWNNEPVLEGYRKDVRRNGKGYILDADGFFVCGSENYHTAPEELCKHLKEEAVRLGF